MKKYGWFEFDPSPRRIVNYLTEQCLAITSSSDFSEGSFYNGHYSDHEISQSIRFLIRKAVGNVIDIELDYRESLVGCPDYGYWRRIDDFMVDALLCWPEFLNQQVIFRLNTVGGWRCGVWTPELKRQFSGRKSGTPDQMAKYPIAEPYMIPLDTPVPMTWRHVDLVTPATKASLKFELLKDSNIPYLSRTSPIQGFQGIVPFLERKDKAAYIIFSELQSSSHRGEDPETLLHYIYIDEDIFFGFRSHPWYSIELSTCTDYGFREFPPRRELWTTGPMGDLISGDTPRPEGNIFSKFSSLSYPIWLRMLNTLGDAWPAWGMPRRKIEIDKSISVSSSYGRIGYIGDYGPTMSDGYSAGMKNSWFQLRYPDT